MKAVERESFRGEEARHFRIDRQRFSTLISVCFFQERLFVMPCEGRLLVLIVL